MDWQTPLALLLVVFATVYVALRVRQSLSATRSRCTDCSGKHDGILVKPLVQVELPSTHSRSVKLPDAIQNAHVDRRPAPPRSTQG